MSSAPPHTEVVMDKRPLCDFCLIHGRRVPASVDGRTRFGAWANMCEPHFEAAGVGLGLGHGQRLIVEPKEEV